MQPMNTSLPLQLVAHNAERRWLWEQGQAHAKAVRLAQEVANASASGRRVSPKLRNAIRHPQAKLSASLKVIGSAQSRDAAKELARRISPWTESYEAIRWHAKEKSSGGERYICKLPAELKAVHYLLKRPLEKLLVPAPNIYGVKGRSRDDLALEIKELQNQGFNCIAVSDIVNCYQSIPPDTVYQLPLPKEVIRRTLDLRYQTLLEDERGGKSKSRPRNTILHDDTPQKARGPKGLMQGSPLSSLILAWVLNGIPSSHEARVFLCFDNLIVLARSPSETRATVKMLAAHFEQCPAGPLALCDATFSDEAPAEFLGYLFDPERTGVGMEIESRNQFLENLMKAEAEQLAIYTEVSERHRALGSTPLLKGHNPLLNHFPTEVWRLLLSFRAGFPSLPDNAPELLWLLENSRWLAERTKSGLTVYLHDHLFDSSDAEAARKIRGILSRGPLPSSTLL